MIDISGHLRSIRSEIGFEDSGCSLMINCCGYQSFTTEDFTRVRPQGRLDYQIIYVYKGSGIYQINDRDEKLTQGSLVVYRPGQPQIYSYYEKDEPEIYWIHFTGTDCEKLLQKYEISNQNIGESLPLKNLFQEIILELQLKKECYEDIVCAVFHKLLAVIKRSAVQNGSVPECNFALDRLIIQLNQTYRDSWSVPQMAEFCHLSEDYFAHYFKKVMQLSPLQYLTDLRIQKAKEMLQWEGMNIASVAVLVGYDDPLYFSRIFKKMTGYSPKMYRNQKFQE